MLTKTSIETAMPLTLLFEAAGRALAPVQGSPLAALVAATYRGGLNGTFATIAEGASVTPSERSILESIATDMEIMTNAKVEILDEAEHNGVMDSWVEIGTNAVRGAIVVARSTVSPAVTNLAERVAGKMSELTPAEIAGKEIVVKPVNPVIDNVALGRLISKFIDGTIVEDPELGLRAGDATAEDIRTMMNTGVPSLDSSVQVWAANLSDEWLQSLWQAIFTGGRQRLYPFVGRGVRSLLTDSVHQQDAALAIFLLANHIVNEGPNEGTLGGVDSVTDYAARFRNQAATQIQRLLEHIEESSERGYLVADRVGGNIIVNEAMYNLFLEEGGTNETLLGLLVSGDSLSDKDAILAGRVKYERLWATELVYRTETNTTMLFNLKKTLLVEEFRQQGYEDAQAGDEDMLIAKERILAFSNEFSEYLETLTIADLDNLYEVCLKGLCKTRYKGTDAYEYLSDIDRIMKENPALEARDAATVAMLKYILRWLISQIRVS